MRSFEMGQLVATRGVVDAVDNDPGLATFIGASLGRYQRCDWGEMCQEDKDMNDLSLSLWRREAFRRVRERGLQDLDHY